VKATPLELSEVILLEPRVFADDRGWFEECWSEARYAGAGVPGPFVQDNLSWSRRGVLRGLHFQHPNGQAKLVTVLQGEVWDVAVDVRAGSPTFGRHVAAVLSGENHRQLYIPAGFAHGFCVTSDAALFHYKVSAPYDPRSERGVRWDDPALALPWPVTQPIVSPKDAALPALDAIARTDLPSWRPAIG
jgi:dTDP-4-dehydrorhamnose 3,5-epimerase